MTTDAITLKECLGLLGLATSKTEGISKPLASLLQLITEDGYLYGYTWSTVHNMKVKIAECDESFDCLINFENFYSIIKSCGEGAIELTMNDKSLGVKSAIMKCKLPIYPIQSGKGMPHPQDATGDEIDFSNIATVLPVCKAVIKKDFVEECYKYIYFGPRGIMATDTDNVALIAKFFFSERIILDVRTVEILNKIGKGKVDVKSKDKRKKIVVTTDKLTYRAYAHTEEMDNYQYDEFADLFQSGPEYTVKISKNTFMQAVSASKLFNYEPRLVFSDKGVFLKVDNSEFIYKISSEACEPFTYQVSVALLSRMLFVKDDEFALYYGNCPDGKPSFLRIDSEDIMEIISTEEDNL